MSVDVAMFQQAFFEEATELLDDLEGQLLQLETHRDDRELLNTIFRCAHSIKGGSATFGFPKIAAFTHHLETLLDEVRSGKVAVSDPMCSALLLSLDQMRALLFEAMGTGGPAPDSSELEGSLMALSSASDKEPATAKSETSSTSWQRYRLRFVPGFDAMRTGADPCLLLADVARMAEIEAVVRDDSKIPTLEELDPEASYVGWEIELSSEASRDEILEAFDFVADGSIVELEPIAAAAVMGDFSGPSSILEKPQRASDTAVLRVSAEKVDRLVNLVGELVIAQAMLQEAAQEIEVEKSSRTMEAIAAVERASRELQERVMGIRLVQMKHALARFPRLVRDMSSAVGKQIDWVTIGEETELDKALIEGLGDPLTHLVRNSIDHGLETVEERRAAGKPETGTIKVHARYEGGSVIIEISDDGRGLNRDRIMAKAVERGLIQESDTLNDEAIYALIFQPGFSTAAAVTDISGRGVGMDIVRQSIQSMNGSINLSTRPGLGTTFRIRLPLTMAIMEGLSLRISKEVYILPLTSIVESLRPTSNDITLVAGRNEIVRVRGEVLPVLRLYEIFQIDGGLDDPSQAILVIVESEGKKAALLVDELITQNQAVVKSLEANYRKVDGITGATILGDGRVALIIDVPGLLRAATGEQGLAVRAA